jgi:hypothetical protein
MVREEFHAIPLRYGRTDGENLPLMTEGKFFAVGYNPKYGLVDVCEDNGDSFFEGRVNIESLLSRLRSMNQKETDSKVEEYIMESYHNWRNCQDNSDSSLKPTLEVLTYRG